MVDVLSFDSYDEMRAFLRRANEAADQQLHPLQVMIGQGNHWVRFHDLPNGMVEFGYVLTKQEVYDCEVEAGANMVEANSSADGALLLLARNYMYGRAWSRLNPDGEYGVTHKVSVWPIERTVVEDAKAVNFNIQLLPLASKINLEHAFRAFRAHVRSTR